MRILIFFFIFSMILPHDLKAQSYYGDDFSVYLNKNKKETSEENSNDKAVPSKDKKSDGNVRSETQSRDTKDNTGNSGDVSGSGTVSADTKSSEKSAGVQLKEDKVSDKNSLSKEETTETKSYKKTDKKSHKKDDEYGEDDIPEELKNLPYIDTDDDTFGAIPRLVRPKLNEVENKEESEDVKVFMKGKKTAVRKDKDDENKERINISILPNKETKLLGGIVECYFGVEIENKTKFDLKRLRLRFIWEMPEKNYKNEKKIVVTDVMAGKTEPQYYSQSGKKICALYSQAEPKIKIDGCLIDGMTEMECVKLLKKNMK